MIISAERLQYVSESTGFRPEILEKVIHLIHLLNCFAEDPYLKNRFVLKGGTALNLFYFDYPRLSVDIDINYIGSIGRDIMLQEKESVETTIEKIIFNEKYISKSKPSDHAGGKWLIRYKSVLRGEGSLEIDINYLDRISIWPINHMDSFQLGPFQALNIPIQDIHELAAGKLRALFSRHSGRDLFDAHRLLTFRKIDFEKLRLGFVVYGAMNRLDWRNIKIEDINFEWREFQNMLVPLMKVTDIAQRKNPKKWAENLLIECRMALRKLLPFHKNEIDFLNKLIDEGEIDASLICNDSALTNNITSHPALQWKALNIKKFKKLR